MKFRVKKNWKKSKYFIMKSKRAVWKGSLSGMLFSYVLQKIAVQLGSLWARGTLVLWILSTLFFNVSHQRAMVHVWISAHLARMHHSSNDDTCEIKFTYLRRQEYNRDEIVENLLNGWTQFMRKLYISRRRYDAKLFSIIFTYYLNRSRKRKGENFTSKA